MSKFKSKYLTKLLTKYRAKYTTSEIRKKLLESKSTEELILLLDLLDYLMAESKLSFHTQVANKEFLSTLTNLLKNQKSTPQDVFNKILILIKKWGIRFESQKDILPNFCEVYNYLLKNKVKFPESNG